MDKYEAYEKYAHYEYIDHGRNAHRSGRKRKTNYQADGRAQEMTAAITAMDDSGDSWVPSYAAALDPLHHERQWVINSVSGFYQDDVITDLTRLIKGGKEANVYCCDAHPATGLELIAAKLYRPRMLRHLKNDAIYKEGRILRDYEGKQVRDTRVMRALQKKTRFGKYVDIMWWIGNEFRAQTELYEAGADVPRPIAHQGNAILMAYLGDGVMPAPTLSEVSLPPEEARPLFERIMDNVERMLAHHYVHGDLSAYNILYWEGRIAIIDFPQLVDARNNSNAFMLLERDIRRVCDYFGRMGVTTNAVQLTADLWERYMRAEL